MIEFLRYPWFKYVHYGAVWISVAITITCLEKGWYALATMNAITLAAMHWCYTDARK